MGLPKGDYIPGKRRAHLALVCMLLRVYFKLNNIQGCTQVARTITNIYGQRNTDQIDLRVCTFSGAAAGGCVIRRKRCLLPTLPEPLRSTHACNSVGWCMAFSISYDVCTPQEFPALYCVTFFYFLGPPQHTRSLTPCPVPHQNSPQEFPALYRVTFFYFLGRTELYNENVELAAKRLGARLIGATACIWVASVSACCFSPRQHAGTWQPDPFVCFRHTVAVMRKDAGGQPLTPIHTRIPNNNTQHTLTGDALAATRKDADVHKRVILRYLVPVSDG